MPSSPSGSPFCTAASGCTGRLWASGPAEEQERELAVAASETSAEEERKITGLKMQRDEIWNSSEKGTASELVWNG